MFSFLSFLGYQLAGEVSKFDIGWGYLEVWLLFPCAHVADSNRVRIRRIWNQKHWGNVPLSGCGVVDLNRVRISNIGLKRCVSFSVQLTHWMCWQDLICSLFFRLNYMFPNFPSLDVPRIFTVKHVFEANKPRLLKQTNLTETAVGTGAILRKQSV